MSTVGSVAAILVLAACTPASGDSPAKPVRRAGAATATATTTTTAATGPIVVELFTSQGCSSCPPADKVVSGLVATGKVGDRDVVPLAFHVDYWNDLGWADPFSRPAWTDRQQRYAHALDGGRVYTPQLVIAGRDHLVGSNARGVVAGIDTAPVPARVEATIEWTAKTATVSATAPAGADAYVAIYEDGITTSVTRGENSGEHLRNDHIVRRFEKVAAAGKAGKVAIELDPAWKQLGAIVLAQGEDMTIVGTRALPAR